MDCAECFKNMTFGFMAGVSVGVVLVYVAVRMFLAEKDES